MPTSIPVGDGGEVTLGEVYRYLLAFEYRQTQANKATDDRISDALGKMVPREVWQLEVLELQSRLNIVENTKREESQSASAFERSLFVVMISVLGTGIADIIARLVTH